jgi:hypothetical protein
MPLTRELEATLRQYVLGQIEEPQRLELEERLIKDQETFEALGLVEQELTEDYLDDRLADVERRGFERHFLCSVDHRRQVEFLRTLRSYATNTAADLQEHPAPTFFTRIVELFRLQPAWTGLAAAALVASIAGSLWFASRTARLNQELEQLRAQYGSEQQQGRELREQIARLTERAREPQAERGRQGLPEEARTISALASRAPEAPLFALSAGLLRGGGALTRIAVPAGAQVVRLRLELPADDHPRYRAVLYDGNAEELWAGSKLTPERLDGRRTVTLVLPSQLLARGDYQIKLGTAPADGQFDVLATYNFRVTTP